MQEPLFLKRQVLVKSVFGSISLLSGMVTSSTKLPRLHGSGVFVATNVFVGVAVFVAGVVAVTVASTGAGRGCHGAERLGS